MELNDEKLIKELYRESLSHELSRPEIQKDKKQFLASFFTPVPQPSFSFASAGFLIPACVVLGAFLLFHQIQLREVPVAGPSAPINLMFGSVMEEAKIRKAEEAAQVRAKEEQANQLASAKAAQDNPVHNHMKPRVIVKRIASRVGPTMVYQKAYRDVPVTVIWVFTGGGKP